MLSYLVGYTISAEKMSKYVTDVITLTIPQKLLLPAQVQNSWRGIYDKLGASGSG